MMQIDTSAVPGWADKTIVLEFQHGENAAVGRRFTEARLVEVSADDSLPSSFGWRESVKCWKRTVAGACAHCSPADQYCRETGRRIAIRRLHSYRDDDTVLLTTAAIRQYFANRSLTAHA